MLDHAPNSALGDEIIHVIKGNGCPLTVDEIVYETGSTRCRVRHQLEELRNTGAVGEVDTDVWWII